MLGLDVFSAVCKPVVADEVGDVFWKDLSMGQLRKCRSFTRENFSLALLDELIFD